MLFVTPQQKTGQLGEEITVKFLKNKGFSIIERNYHKKWGEIDIVAKKGSALHLVEVKSVTHENSGFNPQDNMHRQKRQRLLRVIETYLTEKKWKGNWQVDLALVYLNKIDKKARIDFLENIEFD